MSLHRIATDPARPLSAPTQTATAATQTTTQATALVAAGANGAFEVPVPPVRRQPYAHRAFMGLARSFVHNPAAAALLEGLTPHCAAACRQLAAQAPHDLPALMRALEGNPVLAAWGQARSEAPLPVEWDIWLDADAPADLERARIAHGSEAAGARARALAARYVPAAARALFDGSAAGCDVHLGPSPRQWLTAYAAAAAAMGVAPRPPGVFLDVKSAWTPAAALRRFVDGLEQVLALPCRGVMSFSFAQLRAPQLPAVYLLHGAAGVSLRVADGGLPQAATVLFNGGSLLTLRHGAPAVHRRRLARLEAARHQRQLRLGLYLQEDDLCAAALGALARLVNGRPHTFAVGLAIGSVNGRLEPGLAAGLGRGCQAGAIAAEAAEAARAGR